MFVLSSWLRPPAALLCVLPALAQTQPPDGDLAERLYGISASASPYADELRRIGFTNDYRGMSLWKR